MIKNYAYIWDMWNVHGLKQQYYELKFHECASLFWPMGKKRKLNKKRLETIWNRV